MMCGTTGFDFFGTTGFSFAKNYYNEFYMQISDNDGEKTLASQVRLQGARL
jgi:hypothetical protein